MSVKWVAHLAAGRDAKEAMDSTTDEHGFRVGTPRCGARWVQRADPTINKPAPAPPQIFLPLFAKREEGRSEGTLAELGTTSPQPNDSLASATA